MPGLKRIFKVFDQLNEGEHIDVFKRNDTIIFHVHNDDEHAKVTADPEEREDIGNTCQRLEQGLRKIRGKE